MNVEPPNAPVLNEARLREVLAFIELNPQLWSQDHFTCGSTGCLAGWTVALSERTTVDQLDRQMWGYPAIPDRARELLGLTADQAHDLFNFVAVPDFTAPHGVRHPTFAEFLAVVELVTGIRFKEPADA